MDFNIPDTQLHLIVSAAVMQALDPEKKEALIQGAICSLLRTEGSPDSKTKLELVFDEALLGVAKKLCFEMLETDEGLKKKIRTLIHSAFSKFFEKSQEDLADKLAIALSQALTQPKAL